MEERSITHRASGEGAILRVEITGAPCQIQDMADAIEATIRVLERNQRSKWDVGEGTKKPCGCQEAKNAG